MPAGLLCSARARVVLAGRRLGIALSLSYPHLARPPRLLLVRCPQCKHQLAARLADVLGKTRHATVSDLVVAELLSQA